MARVGAVLKWIILLPVLVAVLMLAVANDQTVTVHLNPFDPADTVLKVDLALYQGFMDEYARTRGFCIPGVDYSEEFDTDEICRETPAAAD